LSPFLQRRPGAPVSGRPLPRLRPRAVKMPLWLLLGAGTALLLLIGVAMQLATHAPEPWRASGASRSQAPIGPARDAAARGANPAAAIVGQSGHALSARAKPGIGPTLPPGEGNPAGQVSARPQADALTVVERAAASGRVRVTERSQPVSAPPPAPKPSPTRVPKPVPPDSRVRLAAARQEIGRLAGPSIPPPETPALPEEPPAPMPEEARPPAPEPVGVPAAEAVRGEPDERDEPELIEREAVRYPPSAAEEGVTGTVHLKIVVSLRGRVETAFVVRSSGDARLDAAAVLSAMRWRYRPARRGDQPVPSVAYVAIQFALSDDSHRRDE
jgi:protein TonB